MSGYTKLFSSILASSIWNEDDHTRIVWVTMLAMSDQHGFVEASLPGLAHQARQTMDQTKNALKVLEAPDEYSKNEDNEGRRVEKIEGGWMVLNYGIYREKRDLKDSPQAVKTRERVRKHREKRAREAELELPLQGVTETLQGVTPASASASVSQEGEMQEGKIDWDLVMGHWNSLAKKYGLPTLMKMTDQRKAKYRSRTDQGRKQGEFWKVLESQLSRLEPWAKGEGDRHWVIDFDFIVKSDSNFTKLEEGKYSKKTFAAKQSNRKPVNDLTRPSPTDAKGTEK